MLDVEKLKEIVICQGIQIRKLKTLFDSLDNDFTEVYKAVDAIQFDHGNLESELKITEEDYRKG